jgi:uncharacterized protein YheU (UPF0270 family)
MVAIMRRGLLTRSNLPSPQHNRSTSCKEETKMTISEQLNAGQAVVINGTMGAVTVRYESSKSRNGKPSRYVAGMIFPGNTLNNYVFSDTLEQAVCHLYQQLAAREAVRVVSELDRAIMTGCVAAL